MNIEKIKAAALDALDELDNCARMECSVEAIGAMNHLTNFVQTVCDRLEAAEASATQWENSYHSEQQDRLETVIALREKLEAAEDQWRICNLHVTQLETKLEAVMKEKP